MLGIDNKNSHKHSERAYGPARKNAHKLTSANNFASKFKAAFANLTFAPVAA